VIHLLALIGVVSISFSAILVRLAAVSPVTATFFRAAYAIPMLAILWAARRGGDRRRRRDRTLALVSGLILAVDLNLYHESIALIGAGLATVIANVQVIFVALVAWAFYEERPTAGGVLIVATVLSGVVLTSGLARHGAYGASPIAGAAAGIAAGVFYAAFLLMYRSANRSLSPVAGPLLDSTIGVAFGALACAVFDSRFSMVPSWPAHFWLIVLALSSQVAGWMLLSAALPRLPALETSVMLLGQPVFSLIWARLLFDERLSTLQWIGAGTVIFGVAALTMRTRLTTNR
jgi:drug/metabolite transporter (DMT)-like permease